jgi:Na+:H+ antiporter, NhaA family
MSPPPSRPPGPTGPPEEEVKPRTAGRVLERARRSQFADQVVAPLAYRLRIDETAGWPMIVASALALLWANLAPTSYEAVWSTEVSVTVGQGAVGASLRDLVNSLLLPFFFLVIGMEVREELTVGHLSGGRRAWLPLLAAIGGMLVPIAAFLTVTWGTPYASAFGVPVATDIAFALALLMTLGDRVPGALKAFLLAFAAADDMGGVLVIALFYGHGLSWLWLGVAVAVAVVGALVLHFLRPQLTSVYVTLGGTLWVSLALAGVHMTVAGVVIGLLIPLRPLFAPEEVAERAGPLVEALGGDGHPRERARLLGRLEELVTRSESPADRAARALTPTVSYFVLPVFGLAMAGTSLSAEAWTGLVDNAAALGTVAGLVLGKPLGILAFTWAGVRLGLADLPPGLRWRHVVGAAALAAIGFTVALFIARLALEPEDLEVVKLAILGSSTLAAVAGVMILATAPTDPGLEEQ